MMYGGTLGCNATLIGASANLVCAGICAARGKPITFVQFLRYGLPIAACQMAVSIGYVLLLHLFMGK
jgi:Na+/H+ antiporter NhaD/arsenite permease-like protein